jgi:hypothetical protein
MTNLKSEIEVRVSECAALNDDNIRWKSRTEQILQKYDRIDPVEYENIQKSVKSLSSERDALDEQVKTVTSNYLESVKENGQKLIKINEVVTIYT